MVMKVYNEIRLETRGGLLQEKRETIDLRHARGKPAST